jgi:putative flippase GtrA
MIIHASRITTWKHEVVLNSRYILAGAANTLVGFGLILILTVAGVNDVLANVCGYLCGFLVGFIASKNFVFRKDGPAKAFILRYLFAYFTSYAINLGVLYAMTHWLDMRPLLAQVLAVASYILTMYGFSRFFVFSKSHLEKPGTSMVSQK